MNDMMKDLDLKTLEKVSGGANISPEVDLLDPAQQEWREAVRASAQARKIHLQTSLEQTVDDILSSYRSIGMELFHLTEFLTPIWDTL